MSAYIKVLLRIMKGYKDYIKDIHHIQIDLWIVNTEE